VYCLRLELCCLGLLATLLTACGGSDDSAGGSNSAAPALLPQDQTIAFVVPGTVSGAVGTTVTNTASGGAGVGAISYVSSNLSVATVNATTGTATLLTVGSTTITATKAPSSGFNQTTATYTVNVTRGTQTISFAQAGPLEVLVGAAATNIASGGAGVGAISYASSNLSVVTVVATTGVATGVAAGSATITATKAADANYNQATATYTLTVQASAPTTSGWTDFSLTPVDETIYVSSSTGNDGQPGTQTQPVATLAAAYALIEDGEADWVLLQRGDTFLLPNGMDWTKNGPATPSSGWMRLGAYGTGNRPIIDCVESALCLQFGPGFQGAAPFTSVAITDIHFTESQRLVNGATTASEAVAVNFIASQYAGGGKAFRNVLLEGNKFSGFQSGIISAGDTDNLIVRRNIFTEFFRSTLHGDGNGVLNSGDNTLLEENIFFRFYDPFMDRVPDDEGNPGDGGWSRRTHSAYLGAEGSSTVRGNIVIRAPEGMMMRNISSHERNVYALDNFTAWNSGQCFGVLPHVGGVTPTDVDNLAIDNYGDALVGNVASGTFARNMVIHSTTGPTNVDVVLWGNADGVGGTNLGVHNMLIERNYLSGALIHQHGAPNVLPHYSGNTVLNNTENVGAVTSRTIAGYLSTAGIGGTTWDDLGMYLIAMERNTWNEAALDLLNYFRVAASLPSLTSNSSGGSARILDQMTTAVAAGAWSFNYQMRAAYSGPLFRVRKWSTGVEADINALPNGTVDLAALAAACQTSSAYVDCGIAVVYDQSGSGFNLSQATETKQPKIATTATLYTTGVANLLAPLWDGVDDTLERGDALGLSGDISLAISILVSQPTPIPFESVPFIIGGAGGRDGFAIFHDDVIPNQKRATYIDVVQNYTTGGAHVPIETYQYNYMVRAAGMQMRNVSMFTNGVELTRDTGSDTTVMSLAGSQTAWGSQGVNLPQLFFANIRSGGAIVWRTSPTGADKSAVDAWYAAQL